MEEDPESEHETTKIEFTQYRSPLCSRYASNQMSYNFSEQKKFTTWRRLWVNLAKQQKVCWYTLLSLKVKHVHLLQRVPVHPQTHTPSSDDVTSLHAGPHLTAMRLCLTPYTAATELDLNLLATVGCRIITIKDTLPNTPSRQVLFYLTGNKPSQNCVHKMINTTVC